MTKKTNNGKHHQTQHHTADTAMTLQNDGPQYCDHHDIQMCDLLPQIVLEIEHSDNNKMGST